MVFEANINLIWGWLGLVLATHVLRLLLPRRGFLAAFALLNTVFFFLTLKLLFLEFEVFENEFGRNFHFGILDFANMAAVLGVLFLLHRIALIAESGGRGWGLAILAPVVPLVFVKGIEAAPVVGLSYMSFRLSQLAYEASLGKVKVPSFLQYLGFTFFVPTALSGPINEYSRHEESLGRPTEWPFNMARILRFFFGAMKFFYFARMGDHFTLKNLLPGYNFYGWSELLFSSAAYYVFFYLRFSGFCDMMIALAAMMGVDVKENFNRPLTARNIAEYWSRWHISLTDYLREIVFGPVYYRLIRVMGPGTTTPALGLALLCNFVVIGLWHGIAWNFFFFGVYHAAGMFVLNLYRGFLLRRLGDRYAAFVGHPLVRGLAWFLTFWFVAFGFLLFDARDTAVLFNNFRP